MADGSEGSGERSAETSSSCQFINRLRIGARCPARSKKRPQTYSDSSTSERSSEGSGSDRSETEKTKVVIPRKHKPKGALFQTTKLVVKLHLHRSGFIMYRRSL